MRIYVLFAFLLFGSSGCGEDTKNTENVNENCPESMADCNPDPCLRLAEENSRIDKTADFGLICSPVYPVANYKFEITISSDTVPDKLGLAWIDVQIDFPEALKSASDELGTDVSTAEYISRKVFPPPASLPTTLTVEATLDPSYFESGSPTLNVMLDYRSEKSGSAIEHIGDYVSEKIEIEKEPVEQLIDVKVAKIGVIFDTPE